MDEEFNKIILINNINQLLIDRNLKISEFEGKTGVSPGYVSRINKEGGSKPGIEFILKAAEVLNISLDVLLKIDITNLTPTERYLINFLEKLTKDTIADKLDWQKETSGNLNNLDNEGSHILFSLKTFMEETDGDYHMEISKTVFESNSFGVHTVINDDCYNLSLKNGTTLYVMNISKSVYKLSDTDAKAIEIWLVHPYDDNDFICSTKNNADIKILIESLYSTIRESFKHPKIRPSAKSIIDAFMKDDLTSYDDIPF